MNTDSNPGSKVPSAAEMQLLQSSLQRMAQAQGERPTGEPPGLSATPTMTALLQALRRRWPVALGVAVITTAAAVMAVFFLLPPKYNVRMSMRVVATRQAGAEDIEYPIFKANMEELMRNPLVVNAALNDKTADGTEIKDLDLVRAKGMGVSEWLEKSLKTDYNLGPEVLRVTLASDQADEAAELLNAIGRAFLKEYAETERKKRQVRIDELRKQKDRMETDLRNYRGILLSQFKSLSVKDREAITVQQQQWVNKLTTAETARRFADDEMAKADSKKLTALARLKNLDKQQVPEEVLFELYARDQTIQGHDKRVAEIDIEIDRLYAKLTEEYFRQFSTPLKHEKIKIRKMKEEREAALKPEIEQRWRKNVRLDLDHQITIAEEEYASHKRRSETLAKEVVELDRQVQQAGGGANKPAQILATEDKIDQARKALDDISKKITDVETETPPSRIIPIEQARRPNDKDRSQQTKIAGAGGFGIFMLALFSVAFLEFRSRKICGPDEVSHGLGLKVLGTVPSMPARSKKASANDGVVDAQWQLQLQEALDAIRTVLLHQARGEARHVIMITSANSAEGKTTLATQLAASLARAWKRTLIIDADLRHPAVHTLFDTPPEPGLAEVLRGEVDAADAIRATSFSRLWALPAGNGDTHAIQALAQDSVQALFKQLKQQYDFIIIDSPPVLPVTDALLIGQYVDGVLFAILSDVSRTPAVYAAQQKLAPLNVPTLGAVILGTEPEHSDKSYRYALK